MLPLLTFTEFFGRFHPVVVHLPIGILLLALFLQLLFRKDQHSLYRVMKVIWLAGLATAFVSALSGYLLSVSGSYEDGPVAVHMWMGLLVLVLTVLMTLRVVTKKTGRINRLISITLLAAILATGHFGGSLTHGPDYLTASFTTTDAVTAGVKPISSIPDAQVYTDIVQPILQAKCYSCHGAPKQKGELRLDNADYLMKGGKNGAVVVPGTAAESELVKRLLLPKSDKKHMPPKQKQQLSAGEISLLQWWVDQGAPLQKQVKELQQTEPVTAYLAALQKQGQTAPAQSMVPPTDVAPADAKALKALRDRGVIVVPVAQNSNYLSVNFINTPGMGTKEMELLLPIQKQLVWLKAGFTPIGDSAVSIIAQCSQLTFLQLNNTRITDRALKNIARLKQLQSLNLVGTGVTLSGIAALKPLTKLKSLYLYQTAITKEHTAQLKAMFPRVAIDLGGYMVPKLPTDTMDATLKKK